MIHRNKCVTQLNRYDTQEQVCHTTQLVWYTWTSVSHNSTGMIQRISVSHNSTGMIQRISVSHNSTSMIHRIKCVTQLKDKCVTQHNWYDTMPAPNLLTLLQLCLQLRKKHHLYYFRVIFGQLCKSIDTCLSVRVNETLVKRIGMRKRIPQIECLAKYWSISEENQLAHLTEESFVFITRTVRCCTNTFTYESWNNTPT